MNRPDDSILEPDQLANVQRYADRLLRDASAHGRFPTPVDDLMSAAKLIVVEDELLNETVIHRFLSKVKTGIATIKSALTKVLALFESNDRLVLIDKSMPRPKLPFVKLHEAGHGTMPHQSKVYALIHDCKKTLDPDVTDLFEREANVFASEVLFQGKLFAQEAHACDFSMKVPIKLAKNFGASNYSTFRRYVVTSPQACCLVVLEPVTLELTGGFKAVVRRIVASKSFDAIFDCSSLFSVITADHAIGSLVPIGKRMVYPHELLLTDRNRDKHKCLGEAFDTKHQILVLIRDMGAISKASILLPGSPDFSTMLENL